MMTLIEIMARSVGARPQQNKNCDVEYLMDAEALERLVELVRADEREHIAKFVEDVYVRQFKNPWREDLAAAIRNRSNT